MPRRAHSSHPTPSTGRSETQVLEASPWLSPAGIHLHGPAPRRSHGLCVDLPSRTTLKRCVPHPTRPGLLELSFPKDTLGRRFVSTGAAGGHAGPVGGHPSARPCLLRSVPTRADLQGNRGSPLRSVRLTSTEQPPFPMALRHGDVWDLTPRGNGGHGEWTGGGCGRGGMISL